MVNVTAAEAQGLADGSYDIKANVSDAAGNAATTASQAITVDETAPTIAITSPVAGDNIINKTEAAAGVTISGTAVAGSAAVVDGQTATITIVDSTNAVKDTYTATVAGGAWSVNVTAAQAQGLADGSYSIKADVSDAAGNAATTVSQAVAVETLPPTVTISTASATTNQSTQTVSGTVAATEAVAGPVTLFDTINGVTTQIGTATVVGGAWSTTVTLPGNGNHSIVAQDTDAAGNVGSSAPACSSRWRLWPRRSQSQAPSPGTTSSTRPRRRPASPSAVPLWPAPAVWRSTVRPRRSRFSTAPTPSRTPIPRRTPARGRST